MKVQLKGLYAQEAPQGCTEGSGWGGVGWVEHGAEGMGGAIVLGAIAAWGAIGFGAIAARRGRIHVMWANGVWLWDRGTLLL